MTVRIGINGFGRIGRITTRAIFKKNLDIELVAINDPFMDLDHMIYLFNYDSVHGVWNNSDNNNISANNTDLIINNKNIKIFKEKNPELIDWDSCDVDYVIDCTGVFITIEKANMHLKNNTNIKSVIISAPSPDAPMFVFGVNHDKYNNQKVISNSSCTTNCLSPLVKILNDKFTIVEGLMTTIHATTATQKTVDGPAGKDWRSGRSVYNNIIPSSTGAAKAVTKIIPELENKLTGMAFRVPVNDGSIVDLTIRTEKSTSLEEIFTLIKQKSDEEFKNIIAISDSELVSSDIIGNSNSCIVDKSSCIMLNNNFFKLVAWYDNEWGYSNRLVDLTYSLSTNTNCKL